MQLNFNELVGKDHRMKIYSACKSVASNLPLEERFSTATQRENSLLKLKKKKRSSEGQLKES
jgi:hypothetical protein